MPLTVGGLARLALPAWASLALDKAWRQTSSTTTTLYTNSTGRNPSFAGMERLSVNHRIKLGLSWCAGEHIVCSLYGEQVTYRGCCCVNLGGREAGTQRAGAPERLIIENCGTWLADIGEYAAQMMNESSWHRVVRGASVCIGVLCSSYGRWSSPGNSEALLCQCRDLPRH